MQARSSVASSKAPKTSACGEPASRRKGEAAERAWVVLSAITQSDVSAANKMPRHPTPPLPSQTAKNTELWMEAARALTLMLGGVDPIPPTWESGMSGRGYLDVVVHPDPRVVRAGLGVEPRRQEAG